MRCLLLHLVRSTSRRLLATKQARTAATTTLSITPTRLYKLQVVTRQSAHQCACSQPTVSLIPRSYLLTLSCFKGALRFRLPRFFAFLFQMQSTIAWHRSRVNPLCNPLTRLHTMWFRGRARYACGQR